MRKSGSRRLSITCATRPFPGLARTTTTAPSTTASTVQSCSSNSTVSQESSMRTTNPPAITSTRSCAPRTATTTARTCCASITRGTITPTRGARTASAKSNACARGRDRSRGPRTRSRDRTRRRNVVRQIGHTCAIADEPASLLFMAVMGRLVLQELGEQLRHFPRLLLLHPMAGAVHQMKAHHAGARGLLHALGGAWGLVDAPVALAPDEHGW